MNIYDVIFDDDAIVSGVIVKKTDKGCYILWEDSTLTFESDTLDSYDVESSVTPLIIRGIVGSSEGYSDCLNKLVFLDDSLLKDGLDEDELSLVLYDRADLEHALNFEYALYGLKFTIVDIDKFRSIVKEGDFICIKAKDLTIQLEPYVKIDKEQAYHNSRTTFAILNNTLVFGPHGLSHADWLMGNLSLDKDSFNSVVRGYYDESGIYFYQGEFETNAEVEEMALKYADNIDKNKPIYCGCIIGEVGEKWEPIKKLR